MPDLTKLYAAYAQNTARFPALYTELARQLNVSEEAVTKAEVGFIPVDHKDNQAWAFPERDSKGAIVGIQERLMDGTKYMVPGSKRGLAYMVNRDTTQYDGNYGWERTSAEYPCPLCGHPDGCMYPKGEYENPNAVTCVTTKVGATKQTGMGYLHILDPARQKLVTQNYSLLLPSDHPVLIVEGWSDVLAAYDIGFVAVGKPSGCSKQTARDLVKLITGRDVVVMGENDAGTGEAGMEATAISLTKACKNLTKLMPPKGVKDIRQWVEKRLTQEELMGHIAGRGQQVTDRPFNDDRTVTIAEVWIKDYNTLDGKRTFSIHNEKYVGFDGVGYERLKKNQVHGQLYRDIGDKLYIDGTGIVKPYKLTRAKVQDILDACTATCLINNDPPCWLTPGDHPNPSRLIVFQNGILDVDSYFAGKPLMTNPDPNLFTFHKLPYAFDEDAESPLWDDTAADIFQAEDKIQLASEWCGLNLVPIMIYEKLMILKGLTRAGKGTYGNTLQALLGYKPNCSVTTFPQLAGQFGLQPLKDALSVVVGDATSTGRPGNENAILLMILNIVGRDRGIVNVKHMNHLDMVKFSCRFTFAMNFFPTFRDDSGSLEERTMILTFNNSHAGREDTSLKDELERQALEGKLINWALQGLKRLYNNEGFTVPDESAVALQAFGELVSPLGHFSRRCIESNPTGVGVVDDIAYDVWKIWCKNEGLKYGGKSDFVHKLLAMTPGMMQILPGEVGNQERMLMGIKMTEWAEAVQNKGTG